MRLPLKASGTERVLDGDMTLRTRMQFQRCFDLKYLVLIEPPAELDARAAYRQRSQLQVCNLQDLVRSVGGHDDVDRLLVVMWHRQA